ncbi:hypothetical protein ACWPXQ_14310, partial [Enterococcus faecium]
HHGSLIELLHTVSLSSFVTISTYLFSSMLPYPFLACHLDMAIRNELIIINRYRFTLSGITSNISTIQYEQEI